MSAASDRRDLLYKGGDMMGEVRQYVISIISVSVICAVFKGILGKGISSRIINVLCGIFMLFTFVGPLKDMDLLDVTGIFRWNEDVTGDAVRTGEEFSQNAMADIISTQITSYVEKKANELGVEVKIKVTLSDDEIPAPMGMDISGQVSPYIRGQLEDFITENIGISREEIRWKGQH